MIGARLLISIRLVLSAVFLVASIAMSAIDGISSAVAQSNGAEVSPNDFSDWVEFYYQAPKPDVVPGATARAIEKRLFDARHAPLFMGFMTGFLRNNPEMLQATLDAMDGLPESDRQYTLAAAWLAAPAGSREATSRRTRLNQSGQSLLDRANAAGIRPGDQVAPLSPYALDYMWGLFFATGDSKAVLPIVSLLGAAQDPNGESMAPTTAAAAEWSIRANAKRHKVIRDFCAAQIPLQPSVIAAKLKTIVEQADAQ
jgi:AcrR family transcriptional regulator